MTHVILTGDTGAKKTHTRYRMIADPTCPQFTLGTMFLYLYTWWLRCIRTTHGIQNTRSHS